MTAGGRRGRMPGWGQTLGRAFAWGNKLATVKVFAADETR